MQTIDPRLAIRNRAERLIKLLDLNAPDCVIGAECWLIMRGAFALGKSATEQMVTDLVGSAKNGSGFCYRDDCHNPLSSHVNAHVQCDKHNQADQEYVEGLEL